MSKELDFLLHQARFVGGLDPHTMPPSGVASHLRTLASAVMAYDEFNPAAPSASPDLDRVKFHAEWPCAFHVGPTPGCEMCRNEGGSGQRLELDKDDLSCVKFHCCLGCGWRGRRYTHGSWLGAGPEKLCPECNQPVWEETTGITTAADDAEHGPCRLECGHEGTCWDGDHIWFREGVSFRPSEVVHGPSTPGPEKRTLGEPLFPHEVADDAGDDTSASACQRCGKPGDFRMGDFHHIWAQDEWDCVASDGPSAEGRIARMAREAGIEAPIRPDSENEVSSPRSDDDVGVATREERLKNALRRIAARCEARLEGLPTNRLEGPLLTLDNILDICEHALGAATPSAVPDLLDVAENALGQATMMLERYDRARNSFVRDITGLGPVLSVVRQAHDEIHNEVERRKRAAVADSASQSAEEAADVIRDTGA